MTGINVTFVEHDGTAKALTDVDVSQSLMEVGRMNGVVGILADCGGACACATCHVYIDPDWADAVGPADEVEQEMLDMVTDLQPTSRLSCQVRLGAGLDGLRVTVAPTW